LGVGEDKLGSALQEEISIKCEKNPSITEILRGIRLHFSKFIKGLKDGDLEKAQLGLGHSYSRSKVKFNVNRADNMIIQSISLIDQLDKDLNLFSMRCKEWYSWHFPELAKVVSENFKFAKLAKFIKNKEQLSEKHLVGLEEITQDSLKAQQILDAARSSMGTSISEIDMMNIMRFADRVISLTQYREKLHAYLFEKMHIIAPNLSALIGEMVAARLIAHSGSLTNLAKSPASTIQILGAEKALFRALKTKGNTPKYGLIFHSSFISQASQKFKGRISRYLANKCAIAARLDCFSDVATSKFGESLRQQVDDRLNFYDNGTVPKKNIDVMHSVLETLNIPTQSNENNNNSKAEETMDVEPSSVVEPTKKSKKDKKIEKRKKRNSCSNTNTDKQ